jgi:hypothetical protein
MAKARKRQDSSGSSAVEDRIDPSQVSATTERQPMSDTDPRRSDRVAARAYELYLARGAGHGSDWDDWLEAERQVASADDGSAGD